MLHYPLFVPRVRLFSTRVSLAAVESDNILSHRKETIALVERRKTQLVKYSNPPKNVAIQSAQKSYKFSDSNMASTSSFIGEETPNSNVGEKKPKSGQEKPKLDKKSNRKVVELLRVEKTVLQQNLEDEEREIQTINQLHMQLDRYPMSFKNFADKYILEELVESMRQPDLFLEVYISHSSRTGSYLDCVAALKFMQRHSLKPTPSSFAHAFLAVAIARKRKLPLEKVECVVKDLLELANSIRVDVSQMCNFRFFPLKEERMISGVVRTIKSEFRLMSSAVRNPPPNSFAATLIKRLQGPPAEDYQQSPYVGILPQDPDKMEQLIEEQLQVEDRNFVTVESAAKIPSGNSQKQSWDRIDSILHGWSAKFHVVLEDLKRGTRSEAVKNIYGVTKVVPILSRIDTKDLVSLMDRKTLTLLEETTQILAQPGSWIEGKLGFDAMALYHSRLRREAGLPEALKQVYREYCTLFTDPELPRTVNHRQHLLNCLSRPNVSSSLHVPLPRWSIKDIYTVGKILLTILLDNATMKSSKHGDLPAFTRKTILNKMVNSSEIRMSSILHKVVSRTESNPRLTFNAMDLPMVCPSRPWIDPDQGGLLVTHSEFTKTIPGFRGLLERTVREVPSENMQPTIDSLNVLGSVGWVLNEPVLKLMLELFQNPNSRESLAYSDILDIPRPVSVLPAVDKQIEQLRIENGWKVNDIKLRPIRYNLRQKQREAHSLYCTSLYRLSVAQKYIGRVIFFAHNMDFRGRVYPIAPLFNHISGDDCRGLLKFAQGRKLGATGLDWLKLHCINLTGTMKKESATKRLHFADSILQSHILDSANEPFGKVGATKWWMESDDPWQTLACCIEIRDALLVEDPAEFVSRLPVHQDGSCNGLQHYAALGLDEKGAEQVNVTPSETPQDVYEAVAKRVEQVRLTDVETDSARAEVAKLCQHAIRRKVVKQTVMTTVYGVTSFGARLQVQRQLKDLDLVPAKSIFQCSYYISRLIFFAIRDMFYATRSMQIWLTQLAHLIAGNCKQTVCWTTPLGLPVAQPYLRTHPQLKVDLPMLSKQKNAFPPNFIHSLDGTHMMLTSLYCYKHGITFASVHDCFWTHACTVAHMNHICRDQFVSMYKLPILEDFCKSLKTRYLTKEFRESVPEDVVEYLERSFTTIPTRGKLNINDVLDSVYFFS